MALNSVYRNLAESKAGVYAPNSCLQVKMTKFAKGHNSRNKFKMPKFSKGRLYYSNKFLQNLFKI